ncbi:hypothetical protein [Cedecea davisae]|uniref:hypothetical protein n=1 Tax=Cedecea davisae TaxID=158484 RepID=UPI00242A9248|nr:hypothetical protein [Cedecea davisae]
MNIRDDIIPTVILDLQELDGNYEEYIKYLFKCEDADFIFKFFSALCQRLIKVREDLRLDNVFLTALETEFKLSTHDDYYQPAVLTSEQRRSGNIATTFTDESKRIFINYDKLYTVDVTHPDPLMREKPVSDLISTLIHEASHIEGMTTDLFYAPREKGEIVAANEVAKDILVKLKAGNVIKKDDFLKLNRDYFNHIQTYRNMHHTLTDGESLSYIAENDPAYFAHILLNNGDGIALLARDLYKISTAEK